MGTQGGVGFMTKKDYIAVAKIFAERKDSNPDAEYMRLELIGDIGQFFSKDNPRFSWSKFNEACNK